MRTRVPNTSFKWVFVVVLLTLFYRRIESANELSDYLWIETQDIQQSALNSAFVQGLKNVSLDPTDFGAYMIQDAVYMYSSKLSIDVAITKAQDPDLKQFLQTTANSYQSLYLDMAKKWHLSDPNGIRLGPACQNYMNHLDHVAKTMDPVYLVVAIIPCVKLWPWLGKQIGSDFGDFGVYTKWVQTDFDPSYKGYEKYEMMVNDAYKEGTIDKDTALSVYTESMKGEAEFFNLQ